MMTPIDYDTANIKTLRSLAHERGLKVSKMQPSPHSPGKMNCNWKLRPELVADLRAWDASHSVQSSPATVSPGKSIFPKVSPKIGHIYIFTNKGLKKGLVKIGKTGDSPKDRARGLFDTSVPCPFKVYASIQTSKFDVVEKAVHGILTTLKKRVDPRREFFKVEPDEALKILESIAGVLDDAKIILGPAARRARSKHL